MKPSPVISAVASASVWQRYSPTLVSAGRRGVGDGVGLGVGRGVGLGVGDGVAVGSGPFDTT